MGCMVRGLRNQGNVCYFNAVAQALASCLSFIDSLQRALAVPDADALKREEAKANSSGSGCRNHGASLASSLLDLLDELQPLDDHMQRPKSSTAQGTLHALRACLGDDVLKASGEHDAAEALELLVNAIESELEAAFKTRVMPILLQKHSLHAIRCASSPVMAGAAAAASEEQLSSSLLHSWNMARLASMNGRTATCMTCLKCHHAYDTHYAPFTILAVTLPIETRDGVLGVARVRRGESIIHLLETMQGREMLQGVRCPGCARLARKFPTSPQSQSQPQSQSPPGSPSAGSRHAKHGGAPAMRWTEVVRWPDTLILNLRRSMWSFEGHHEAKVVGHVAFPARLVVPRRDHQNRSSAEADPSLDTVYELVAVVVHAGLTTESGHYITYRRMNVLHTSGDGVDDDGGETCVGLQRWLMVSDESIRQIEFQEVAACEASLLFYESCPGV